MAARGSSSTPRAPRPSGARCARSSRGPSSGGRSPPPAAARSRRGSTGGGTRRGRSRSRASSGRAGRATGPRRPGGDAVPLTAIAFAGVFALALVLAFVRHPIFGLGAYLLAFFNHPPDRWWGQSLPDLRWSLLAAAVTLVAAL